MFIRVTDIVNYVLEVISEVHGTTVEELKSASRNRWLVRARFVVFYFAKNHGNSFAHIGRMMGGRDHTTIMYGYEQAMILIENDNDFGLIVDRVQKLIDGHAQRVEERLARFEAVILKNTEYQAGPKMKYMWNDKIEALIA